MQLIANESKIELRKKIGERAPFVGLIVLVISTVILFAKPEWLSISMIIVWIGLLISLTGSYLGDRYVGPFAHHRKVPEALKGLPDSYVLFAYALPIPFVLLEPGCLTVLTVKSQSGGVLYADGRWKHQQKWGFARRFAGQEGLGSPDKLTDAEIETLKRYLGKHLPEDLDVPIRGIVLFTHPEIHLDVENSPLPALRSAELKRWLRRNAYKQQLSVEVRSALLTALGASTADSSPK